MNKDKEEMGAMIPQVEVVKGEQRADDLSELCGLCSYPNIKYN